MPKILIVPEKLHVEVGSSFLDRRSFTVRAAPSGEAAIRFAVSWAPDMILLSSSVGPGMDAKEMCAAFREQPELDGIKILLLTVAITSAPTFVVSVGADAHLIQPFDERQLLQSIGSLLEVRTRRTPRINVEILARVEEPDSDDASPSMANIVSLSEHGVLLESERLLTIGNVSNIMFFLPGAQLAVHVRGKVLYADELVLQYAIEFVDVGEEERRSLREFVDTHRPQRL